MNKSGFITYKQAATQIRKALKRRSGKAWSVTTSRGTAYGWLRIVSPPSRHREPDSSFMTDADRAELARLLNLPDVHGQGVMVPPYEDYYMEYIDRAEGIEPIVLGTTEFGD